MSKHATVRLDGMTIPLIGIKPSETEEKCDKCQRQFHVQEIALIDGEFICQNCAPQLKPLEQLTSHLKEIRENQPRVTAEQARAQAKRVMAAKNKRKS